MAYLPERALPDTFGAFVALRQGLGLVPNIFREAGHPAISWK